MTDSKKWGYLALALLVFLVLVVLVIFAGPLVSFVKLVLMVIGALTIAKWVLEALSDG